MGERQQGTLFSPKFNRSVRVEAADLSLSEDAGALALREVAQDLGVLSALERLADSRDLARVTHPLVELAMTRILLYGQGLRHQDDADRYRHDQAFRMSVSTRGGDRAVQPARRPREPEALASQPTLSRMGSMLATEENQRALADALLDVSCRRVQKHYPNVDEVTLDVDSFAQAVHGRQEGAVYNGHYHMTCMHPLHAVLDTGDLVGVQLRPGNVHTAEGVQSFLEPIVAKLQTVTPSLWVRVDAGFASGDLFDWLEERDVRWVTRLKTNPRLVERTRAWRERVSTRWQRDRDPEVRRETTFTFWYRANGWSRARRVVAVLVERQETNGELFDDLFFIASNVRPADAPATALLDRYRRRGLAEQRIGELKNDIAPTLSSATLAENQVTITLAGIAYELIHHLRERIAAQRADEPTMTIRTVRERILKAATIVVHRSRRVYFRICATKRGAWNRLARALGPRQEGIATY